MVLRWLRSARFTAARPYLTVLGLLLLTLGLTTTVHPAQGFSPFTPLFYLPLIVAMLICPFEFVVLIGLVISALVVGMEIRIHYRHTTEAEYTAFLLSAFSRGLAINLVAVLGGLCARQLRKKQSALTQRLQEADALLNTFVWINTSNSLEDCVDILLLAMRQIKPYHVATVFLRDEPSLLVACGGSGAASEIQFSRLTLEAAGIAGSEGAQGMIYVPDTERRQSHPLARLVPAARSFAAVPLLLPDYQMIGLLYLGFDRPEALRAEDCQVIEDFAARIAFPLQKVRQQERLHGMAYTDAMTGLRNYRAFCAQLDEEVRRATRYNHPVSLLLLDLDLFKQVNDQFGHQVGDRALMHLATVLRASVRDTDLPARYGGEEFVVLCPETDADEALVVAERIRQAVASTPFLDGEHAPVYLTVSIGVATFPWDADDDATLIHNADAALYQAKRAGRNRVFPARQFETALVDTTKTHNLADSSKPTWDNLLPEAS